MLRRTPFHRVPKVAVPRLHWYYQGAPIPDFESLTHFVLLLGTVGSCFVCAVARTFPSQLQDRRRTRVIIGHTGRSPSRFAHTRTRTCLPDFLPIHPVTLRHSSTLARPVDLTDSSVSRTTPAVSTTVAPTLTISGLNRSLSPPAVCASRRPLPSAVPHALPAGGMRLCWREVEPAGSRRQVSDHPVLPAAPWTRATLGHVY